MARVWVAVVSVWAVLAIVATLAWTRPPVVAAPSPTSQTLVVKTANGKQRLVVVQPGALGASHATTHTSGAPR